MLGLAFVFSDHLCLFRDVLTWLGVFSLLLVLLLNGLDVVLLVLLAGLLGGLGAVAGFLDGLWSGRKEQVVVGEFLLGVQSVLSSYRRSTLVVVDSWRGWSAEQSPRSWSRRLDG